MSVGFTTQVGGVFSKKLMNNRQLAAEVTPLESVTRQRTSQEKFEPAGVGTIRVVLQAVGSLKVAPTQHCHSKVTGPPSGSKLEQAERSSEVSGGVMATLISAWVTTWPWYSIA